MLVELRDGIKLRWRTSHSMYNGAVCVAYTKNRTTLLDCQRFNYCGGEVRHVCEGDTLSGHPCCNRRQPSCKCYFFAVQTGRHSPAAAEEQENSKESDDGVLNQLSTAPAGQTVKCHMGMHVQGQTAAAGRSCWPDSEVPYTAAADRLQNTQ
jgi:hypothetical protein